MSGFEGSYLGANDRISTAAVMECKICWTPYDPAEGDDYRQVLPGTPFADLPEDWHCPGCGAPKAQFMVLADPGSADMARAAAIATRTAALEADFREIWNAKMKDVPIVNAALHVQAVGFREWEGQVLGVLISPWFLNLVVLPGDATWPSLRAGEKEVIAFPSGEYEFIHNTREMVGAYKACSLFSPMGDFSSQLQAVEVGNAIMAALFEPDHREETDRAAEIRAAAEGAAKAAAEGNPAKAAPDGAAEPAAEPAEPYVPTRRALISAGLAED
jgi:[NiFe] hydrogenase assembly HybE family chaperone